MPEWLAFHKTVTGASHIRKGIPCQDCSGSFEADEYRLAVVSDGHGDMSCFRSDTGAELAVEVCISSLKEFASGLLADSGSFQTFLIEKHRKEMIRRLTDVILSSWSEAIVEHYRTHPLTPEERKYLADPDRNEYSDHEIEHIYGATLIAALMIRDQLIMLQQGDGKCIVLTENDALQPVPWDQRCHENSTTSLSDEDASVSVRYAVLDLNKENPVACFLTSDGVEDSFRDMEGTYGFLKSIVSTALKTDFPAVLQSELEKLTAVGSGDDISISGMINIAKAEEVSGRFAAESVRKEMEDAVQSDRGKLISMERKKEILKSRAEVAEKNKEKLLKQISDLDDRIAILERKKNSRQLFVEDLSPEQIELMALAETLSITKFYYILSQQIHEMRVRYSREISECRKQLSILKKQYDDPGSDENQIIAEYSKYFDRYTAVEEHLKDTERKLVELGGL